VATWILVPESSLKGDRAAYDAIKTKLNPAQITLGCFLVGEPHKAIRCLLSRGDSSDKESSGQRELRASPVQAAVPRANYRNSKKKPEAIAEGCLLQVIHDEAKIEKLLRRGHTEEGGNRKSQVAESPPKLLQSFSISERRCKRSA